MAWLWLGVVVFGACTAFSALVGWLAYGSDPGGAMLIGAFGVLMGVLLLGTVVKLVSAYRGREDLAPAEGVKFVPHWQVMTILSLAAIAMVLAVVVPMLFR